MALMGINRFFPLFFPGENILPLSGGFTLIAFIAMLVFFSGYVKNPEKSVLMTLISISLKMLLSMILALVYLLVLKNKDTGSVILFFVLYLGFTIFVLFTFLNVLKKRSV
jgi:NADH:ubiquinone oxidoreductase subunit K